MRKVLTHSNDRIYAYTSSKGNSAGMLHVGERGAFSAVKFPLVRAGRTAGS
jgi:hypothetical protein